MNIFFKKFFFLRSVIVLSFILSVIISNQILKFNDINISKFSYNQSYENDPINYSNEIVSKIELIDDVENIQQFATKAGIIKKEEEILGVIIKGVGQDIIGGFLKKILFLVNFLFMIL